MTHIPAWLTALLTERYPRARPGLPLLTLALRHAATAHLQVQVPTDDEILTGQQTCLSLTPHLTIPEPLWGER